MKGEGVHTAMVEDGGPQLLLMDSGNIPWITIRKSQAIALRRSLDLRIKNWPKKGSK
jgi:hypothetical protein